MITPSSGMLENMDLETRNPIAKVRISWANVLLSGEWFRLDQSILDNNALLTIKSYLSGETIEEYVNEVDGYKFDEETEYVKTLEGYAELIGDNYQYSSSDFDCELVNSNNRFTPRNNKNKLKNPGFENSFDYWNLIASGINYINIDEQNFKTGIRSAYFRNTQASGVCMFSDRIQLHDDIPIESDEYWSYSQNLVGSGIAHIQLRAYNDDNLFSNDETTGLIKTENLLINLVSGSWQRPYVNFNVPSGAVYLRSLMSLSGQWMRADDGQIEQGYDITEYDDNFIGDLILPKRIIKVDVGFGTDVIPKFSGMINKIHPNLKEDTVQIYAYDWSDKLKDTIITSELYEGKRTDELISILADKVGINAEKRNIEIGVHTVAFAWFPEGSAWYYMTQIAEAEGGRIFFDEEGTLNFWNMNHVSFQNSASVYNFKINKNIINLDYEISKKYIKNRIIVKANPKKKLTRTVIFSDTGSSLNAGDTREFWCQFSHGADVSVPAINVELPTIGTNIIANTEYDGSGTNISSNIEITSYSIFGESIKINLKNNNSNTAYFTTFKVYGEPIIIASKIEVIKEDSNSQKLYDTQELQLENNYIDSESYAEGLATQKLEQLKDYRNFVKIECIGAPHLQLGDVVSIEKGFDKIVENYTIIKNRWQFDGDFTQNLELEKKILITWFVLDVSILDSQDRLYL